MSGEFKARVVDAAEYYHLKQFVFVKGNMVDSLLIGSIAGLLFSGAKHTVLLAILIGVYFITAIPLWKKRKKFVKMFDQADRMVLNEEGVEISRQSGEVLESKSIDKSQKIYLQIRASAWRERIWDHFRPDFKERSANFIKIGDRRIDFILESDYALQQLMDLVIVWENKGLDLQIDIEKCFVHHLKRLPSRLQ